jgi:hypothetical protein
MNELITWLHAQLDQEAELAHAALAEAPGHEGRWVPTTPRPVHVHQARWDPAHALTEIETKRRILNLHASEHDCPEMVTGTYPADWPEAAPWGKAGDHWAHPSNEHFELGTPCPTVRLLAQPYADRDGWREEWATP